LTSGVAVIYTLCSVATAYAYAYALNQLVPDVRQPASVSGGDQSERVAKVAIQPGTAMPPISIAMTYMRTTVWASRLF
jgi:hypothetical protein